MKNTSGRDYTFSYTSATTITMTPNGKDGNAYVYCGDGSNGRMVTVGAAITCVITTSGAGGLDTGSESASTGYYVYLIASTSDPATYPPALLFSLSSSTPTMPTGYGLRSKPIWFVSNSLGGSNNDIYPFVHCGDTCYYDIETAGTAYGIQLIDNGTANSSTLITSAYAIPSIASYYQAYYIMSNSSNTYTNFTAWYANGTTNSVLAIKVQGATNGGDVIDQQPVLLNPTRPIYYNFSATPTGGLDLHIKGWSL